MTPRKLTSFQYAIMNLMETQYNVTRSRRTASSTTQLAIDKQLAEINRHLTNLSVKYVTDYRIAYEAFKENDWVRQLISDIK